MLYRIWLLMVGVMLAILGVVALIMVDRQRSIDALKAFDPWHSTYQPQTTGAIFISNARAYMGDGTALDDADLLIRSGKIDAVGSDLTPPPDARVIDAEGRWLTPGIIDIHSHLGVYPTPAFSSNSDGNEATDPATPQVWAEHSVWPQDLGFPKALRGGVTSLHILPGSANLFGGRGVTLRNVVNPTVQSMKFPDAPPSLKMACGENPKRVYGHRNTAPSTRMGNMALYRKHWIDAHAYLDKKNQAEDEIIPRHERDLAMETLSGVIEGNIRVQMHCYRAEEMAAMLRVAEEFDYKISAFHHAIEAYKIADLLAEHGVCAAVWADWWGFKHEAYDMVYANAAMVDRGGDGKGCAVIHSDSARDIQHLNLEVAKAWAAGVRAGLNISKARAFSWITLNPARALGIDDETGSLTPGKRADLVLWSMDPFDTFARVEQVFIDGVEMYNWEDAGLQPVTDAGLGAIRPEGSIK